MSRHKLQNFHDSQSDVVTCLNLTGGIIAFLLFATFAMKKEYNSSYYEQDCEDNASNPQPVIVVNKWIGISFTEECTENCQENEQCETAHLSWFLSPDMKRTQTVSQNPTQSEITNLVLNLCSN